MERRGRDLYMLNQVSSGLIATQEEWSSGFWYVGLSTPEGSDHAAFGVSLGVATKGFGKRGIARPFTTHSYTVRSFAATAFQV